MNHDNAEFLLEVAFRVRVTNPQMKELVKNLSDFIWPFGEYVELKHGTAVYTAPAIRLTEIETKTEVHDVRR